MTLQRRTVWSPYGRRHKHRRSESGRWLLPKELNHNSKAGFPQNSLPVHTIPLTTRFQYCFSRVPIKLWGVNQATHYPVELTGTLLLLAAFMSTYTQRPEDNLRYHLQECHPPPWKNYSQWHGDHRLGWTDWPLSLGITSVNHHADFLHRLWVSENQDWVFTLSRQN